MISIRIVIKNDMKNIIIGQGKFAVLKEVQKKLSILLQLLQRTNQVKRIIWNSYTVKNIERKEN